MSTKAQKPEEAAASEQTRLLSEFPPLTYEEWRQAVEKQLKGAPFEKKLTTKTYEGITVQPIYMQQDAEGLPYTDSFPGFTPYLRGRDASGYKAEPWAVCQEIPYGSPAEFNKALRNDLERGQTAVYLLLDKTARWGLDPDQSKVGDVGKGGVSIATLDDLMQALEGIELESVQIVLQPGASAIPVAVLLAAFAKKQNIALEKCYGCIEFDPLGILAQEGSLPCSLDTAYKQMVGLTVWANNHAPHLQTIAVQGHPYHNSGGNAVQELAFVIATAVEYLREMLTRGLAINDVAQRIRFTFSIGSNYFMEVVKLRAARVMWAKVVKAFGGNETSQKMTIHVRTGLWNKTILDPYVNMLRTTVEAFAGAVGGCNSMHVGCFDESVRIPDQLSRRIARNTQLILEDEAHLSEFIDPAGGSWYVEKLTDELARKTWELFQEVERQGGMAKALQVGFPQEQVAQTAKERVTNLATRKDVMVGMNMYSNLDEKPLEPRQSATEELYKDRSATVKNYRTSQGGNVGAQILEKLPKIFDTAPAGVVEHLIKAASSGATLGDLAKVLHFGKETAPTITPMRIQRGTEIFEALRAASDAYKAKTGSRPKVFLANMGPIPQHKARADFSTGFFQVGGFDVIGNDGFATPEEAVKAALDSKAPIVVICSTDATYPTLVPPITKQIKAAKPQMLVILAGYPKDQVEAYKQAGIDEFIHIRANVYEILVSLIKKLNIG